MGVGDILIDREEPETIFRHVAPVLSAADVAFANLEQTYSEKGYLIRGHGTNSEPRNIPPLSYAGFDVVSLANNHTLDWGVENLLDTLERLTAAGLPYAGAGKNLAEARRPIILERKGTTLGILAYSCVHPKGYEAEEDKPGLAPVRVWTIYEQVDYQPGTPPRVITMPYKEDLAAMTEDIRQLRQLVDVVIVSIHWGLHIIPKIIPMYCFDIGHAAVDAGADLILGTHPHILKGVEVYKEKVIFYSTGNFACEIGPAQRQKGGDFAVKLVERYGCVPDPECPTYNLSRESRSTLIVKAAIEDGTIKQVSYIPCFVNKYSEPEIVSADSPLGQEVYKYVEDISASEHLPVHFSWDRDEVLVLK